VCSKWGRASNSCFSCVVTFFLARSQGGGRVSGVGEQNITFPKKITKIDVYKALFTRFQRDKRETQGQKSLQETRLDLGFQGSQIQCVDHLAMGDFCELLQISQLI
jgi:hypothetical protein